MNEVGITDVVSDLLVTMYVFQITFSTFAYKVFFFRWYSFQVVNPLKPEFISKLI